MMQVVSAFRRGLQPASASLSTSFASMSVRAVATKAVAPLRDPARPVKPQTPFFLYLSNFRKSEESKALAAKDVVAKAGSKWKALTATEKAPYEKAYESKKEAYDAAFKQYKDSGKLDAWKRDPEKPKKPLTGYMRFSAEYRDRNSSAISSMKATEVMKQCSAEWGKLPDDQKAKYNDAYKADAAKYETDLKAYKASGKEQAFKEKTGIAAVEKKAALKKQKLAEKAKKERVSARAKLVNEKNKLKTKKAAERAKKLVSKQKEQDKKLKLREKAKMSLLKKQQLKAKDALKKIEQAKKHLLKTMNKSAKAASKRAATK